MKRFIRMLSLVIVLVMMFSVIVACDNGGSDVTNNGSQGGNTTNVITTAPEVTTSGSEESKLKRDFNGRTFTVLGHDGSNTAVGKNFEIVIDENSMDSVNEAVWKRNEKLKRDYNFEIAQALVPNVSIAAYNNYISGDSKYDVVIYQPQGAIQHANDAYLINLYDLEPLDLSHKAFSEKTNAKLTLGGKLYATTSAFLLKDKSAMNILYYNTRLAEKVSVDIKESVADNSWDIETFYKAMRDVVDADATKKGMIANSSASAGAFISGMGFDMFDTYDGKIEIPSELGEAGILFFDTVNTVLFDSTLAEIPSTVIGADGNAGRDTFCSGGSLFYAGVVHDVYSGSLSESCEFDIGILPFPKFETEQTEYRNLSYGDTSVFAVPRFAEIPYDSAFFLQAISEYSLDTTYDAYLETCQLRLTSAEAYDMLKFALANVHYDIVSVVNPNNFYYSFLNTLHEGMSLERYWMHSASGAQSYLGQLELNFSERKKYVPED